jgi:TatD DNase family protein
MKYIDIHVHPPLFDDSEVISVVDISSSAKSISILTQYCTYGIHPWFLTEESLDSQVYILEDLLKNNAIIAIGEVGIDKIRSENIETQLHVFDIIISLSEYYKKPLIIHCVKGFDNLLSLHKNRKVKQPWIIHGFHGNHELALQLIRHKILLSFGAKLLKDSKLQSVFSKTPIDFIFLETDNSENSIIEVYKTATAIKNIDIKTLRSIVCENFKRIFSLPLPL